jgi:CheY-like chemotaxis protein
MDVERDFVETVSETYQHLYDFVYLRNHPLAEHLPQKPPNSSKERGWQFHNLLLDVIEALNPGANVPPYSREWRRHRLMVMRYIDGFDPQQVANELAISRRQYYREHAAAIEAAAVTLRQRLEVEMASESDDLLQEEVARITQHEHVAEIGAVIEGVLPLLRGIMADHELEIEIDAPETLPTVLVGHSLLRHVILGLLGYVVEQIQASTLRLSVEAANNQVVLVVSFERDMPEPNPATHERLEPLREMLRLNNATLESPHPTDALGWFKLILPAHYQATVLVVDDNEDMLALYERYLIPNHYRVFGAHDATNALVLARAQQPSVIMLDLMMPGQDGWEILRSLNIQPETQQIPVVVCSVLKQRELALALGAVGFLEKPITEASLLAAVRAVTHRNDNPDVSTNR